MPSAMTLLRYWHGNSEDQSAQQKIFHRTDNNSMRPFRLSYGPGPVRDLPEARGSYIEEAQRAEDCSAMELAHPRC